MPRPRKPVARSRASTAPEPAPSRKVPPIPPILLEPETAALVADSGPGRKFVLAPAPPAPSPEAPEALPEAYGTKSLLLAARDPHCVYAHWDLTAEQQRDYAAQSESGKLVLRIYPEAPAGRPAIETAVEQGARHSFVGVEEAGRKYVGQIGYYDSGSHWTPISTSTPTITPPDAVSPDTAVEFSKIPAELPFADLLSLVKEAASESAPLAEEVRQLAPAEAAAEPAGRPAPMAQEPAPIPSAPTVLQFFGASPPQPAREERPEPIAQPRRATAPPPARFAGAHGAAVSRIEWTPARERALAEVISMDHVHRVWMGSVEITELIRRQYARELASQAAAKMAPIGPGAPEAKGLPPGAISSPLGAGGEEKAKGFWFNVNAELIVYGATEPDASVTIGGRPVRLRPDGSFSLRFSLPDGQYELPVEAISADKRDGRAASLRFRRGTEYRGKVDVHAQDPALKPPEPQNL
jgi:hypothetical protein